MITKKLLLLMIPVLMLKGVVYAQQDPLYALYLNNPLVINPAYTGMNNNFNAQAGFRKQWAGFNGSPQTLSFITHSSIRDNKMGAGVIIVSDQIGDINTTQFSGTYSYKVQLTHDRILSFGMQAGFLSYKTNGKVLVQDQGDPDFIPVSQVKPLIGAGVMLKSERYLLGFSVPRLLNSSFNLQGQSITVYQQHYYLFTAYIFNLSTRVIFKPTVLLKGVKGSPLSADVNLNLNIDRNYTVGVFTRNLNSYGILAQLNFMNYYRLAYALELPTNKSVGAQYTTHEINIGIKLSLLSFQDKSITNF